MNLYDQIGEEKIDQLVMYMYDDIIPNDDRINLLFIEGFDKIKIEQKRFFRLFLGEPGHSVFATPDLRKKHMKLPISIKEDEKNNYLHILNNSPVIISEYYLARFIRLIITFIISIVVVFAVGHIFRDVNMTAREWIMSAVLMLIGSITFLGMGLLLSLIKSEEKLSLLANILYLGLAMLGGLWWPVYLFPEWLQNISKLTPTYYLLEFVNKYIKEDIFSYKALAILLAYSVVCIIATLVIKNRRESK